MHLRADLPAQLETKIQRYKHRLYTTVTFVLISEMTLCFVGIILAAVYSKTFPRCQHKPCIGMYDGIMLVNEQNQTAFNQSFCTSGLYIGGKRPYITCRYYSDASLPITAGMMLLLYIVSGIAYLFALTKHSAPLMVPILVMKAMIACLLPLVLVYYILMVKTQWVGLIASVVVTIGWTVTTSMTWKNYQHLEEQTAVKRNMSMQAIKRAEHLNAEHHRPNPKFSTAPSAGDLPNFEELHLYQRRRNRTDSTGSWSTIHSADHHRTNNHRVRFELGPPVSHSADCSPAQETRPKIHLPSRKQNVIDAPIIKSCLSSEASEDEDQEPQLTVEEEIELKAEQYATYDGDQSDDTTIKPMQLVVQTINEETLSEADGDDLHPPDPKYDPTFLKPTTSEHRTLSISSNTDSAI